MSHRSGFNLAGMTESSPRTWILTGSVENFHATRDREFEVIGMKERRRRLSEQIEPGDQIVFYLTKIQAFGAIVRVTGPMYEDRTPIWPGKPGKPDPYPWRFETEPVLVLDDADFVPAEPLAASLEHVAKWPAEHWHLAFQGQLRSISVRDTAVLEEALRTAATRSGSAAVSGSQ